MAKGKIENLDKASKKITIKGKEHTIGKKTWNREELGSKLEVGNEIEYNLKGPNFEFVRIISSEEKAMSQPNRNNRGNNNRSFSKQSSSPIIFSYPYNFVGLNSKCERKSYSKGNNSGTIKCSLENKSPLFISGKKVEDMNGHIMEYFMHDGNNYIIPGSSLKGMIRSVFEAATGSCIPNISGDRLEERKTAGDFNNRTYGIIKRLPTEHDDGLIVEAEAARISHDALGEYNNSRNPRRPNFREGWYPLDLETSVRNYASTNSDKSPKVINNLDDVTGRSQVEGGLFIGSQIFNKKKEKIIFEKKDGNTYPLSKDEYEDIKYIIKQRKEREEKNNGNYAFEAPETGDAIIFLVDNNGKATSLAFSEIPRLRYKLSPYDLLEEEHKACKTSKECCISCRTFGMTGNDKEDIAEEDKLNLSARGKLFFTDATVDKKTVENNDNIQQSPRLIKSLGEPHPTQTAFYLDNVRGVGYTKGTTLRGRKFYWHHTAKLETEYNTFKNSITPERKEKHNSSIEFMNHGNQFEFSIRYENLNKDELEALVYSLELEEKMLHKVGKAKALGFGSCKITIKEILQDSKNKYISFDNVGETIDKELLKQEFISSEYKESKERKELRSILGTDNKLDFTKSPFPEAEGRNRNMGISTLSWFMNMKREHKNNFKLPKILDY